LGFYIRKRVRLGKGTWLNISKRGISASQRIGPFTMNSRGRTSVRLGKGIGYRGGCLVAIAVPIALAGAVAAALGLLASRTF
jgi:hypothetical protein